MPSQLPGQITLPTRDEIKARYKQSHTSRDSDTDIDDPNLEIDASAMADVLLPAYANQRIIGSNTVLEDATDGALTQHGRREGVGDRLEATGSSGAVIISTSGGGTTVDEDRELSNPDTGLKYNAVLGVATKHFDDEEEFTVQAVDVGPRTNLAAGTLLYWSSAPSGAGPSVTVAENTDGSGLTGGRDTETDEEYRLRIRDEKADRSRDGNDAHYRSKVKETPGVRVQESFAWPAIAGTGSTAAAATLVPAQPGGSRVPNESQRALIEAFVVAQMPGDDCSFFPVMSEQDVDILYQLNWNEAAAGWTDVNPWPKYYAAAGTPGGVIVQSAANATHFVLKTANSNYSGIRQPIAGQTIAFYNQDEGEFSKKRLLSVTGTGPWTIVADTTNSASDETYTPIVGQRAMPNSDSLPALLPGIFTYFDGLGPGEMLAAFYDAGRRGRRQPQSPIEWPNALTAKGLEDAIDVDQVAERQAIDGVGLTTFIGTPGVLVYLMRLRWVSVFPL